MRFRLIFRKTGKHSILPINYQYELGSWIYKILAEADKQYAQYLHEKGFAFQNKHFKLFTFSPLRFYPFRVYKQERRIEMLSDEAEMGISFYVDESAEHFIKGLFMQQKLKLGDKISSVLLEVERIEAMEKPVFTTTMHYKTLSPMVVAMNRKEENRPALYLSPEHGAFTRIFKDNLVNKLLALGGVGANDIPSEYEDDPVSFRLTSDVRSKLITIKSHTSHPVKVKGYLFDFELTAPEMIHEIGYYGGFGEKNSLGFGYVEQLVRD